MSTDKKIVTKFELVTPALAKKYLDTMGKNRSLRRATVKAYARDMASGAWRPSHQGIAFDENGRLSDGQHRLAAISESGISLEMNVTRNLPEDSVLVFDTGIKRSNHDVLKISGIEAASPRFVAIAKKFLTGRATIQSQGAQTVSELLDAITLHQDALTFAYLHYGNRQKGLGMASIPAAVARAAYHVPHDRLIRFCEILQSGMPDSPEERIILTLRNWVLENINQKQKLTSDGVYAKTERCIEIFANNEDVKTIYQSSQELFPLPTLDPQGVFESMATAS